MTGPFFAQHKYPPKILIFLYCTIILPDVVHPSDMILCLLKKGRLVVDWLGYGIEWSFLGLTGLPGVG